MDASGAMNLKNHKKWLNPIESERKFKILKSEIGWILNFERTCASQQKLILWDSGNWISNKVVGAYSIQND